MAPCPLRIISVSEDGRHDFPDIVGTAHREKVDHGDAGMNEFVGLLDTPLDAYLPDCLICLTAN